ncbi:MAG TPA: hypothetical protein VJM48_08225, partial [Methylibium sp.]|nr:hypothetical protein [Methylibium sp.]
MLNISVNPRTGEASVAPLPRPAPVPLGERPLWEVRTEERDYAYLPEVELPEVNRYGQKIDLVEHTGGQGPMQAPGRSMYINENPQVGPNPNRNKQHGF